MKFPADRARGCYLKILEYIITSEVKVKWIGAVCVKDIAVKGSAMGVVSVSLRAVTGREVPRTLVFVCLVE